MSTNAPNKIPENSKSLKEMYSSMAPLSKPAPKYGKVLGKKALFMRTYVGDATDPDDDNKSYEMSTDMSCQPMITSKMTGKTFTLSWHDLIQMAVKARIDLD
jgi:hypothetical protein